MKSYNDKKQASTDEEVKWIYIKFTAQLLMFVLCMYLISGGRI